MVISDKYKCIFIHNNKAAGTSIEHVLRPVSLFKKHYITAYQIRDFVGRDRWNKYFKFMIVRNPWDKMVSLYHYRKKIDMIPSSMTFSSFIHNLDSLPNNRGRKINKVRTSNQLGYCTDKDGSIMVDYIGRFEKLDKSWRYICNQINFKKKLPHMKSGKKKNKKMHYSTYYDDAMRDVIADRFSRDIEHFGYSFVDKRR